MNTIDLSPLYRSGIGFDRLNTLLNSAQRTDNNSADFPAYNITMFEENKYGITLAVAGFRQEDLSIDIEQNVLRVRGNKKDSEDEHRFLHKGIAYKRFERHFNLTEYVEVSEANLADGLLNITLVREVPESMKPKRIEIGHSNPRLEHQSGKVEAEE
jgi:molecular chaperone IbpA